ncbi:MAG: DUF4265 domain-containing protein [Myxococcota bacterium]
MDLEEFSQRLGWRVSSELHQFGDKSFHIGLDDFFPPSLVREEGRTYAEGRAIEFDGTEYTYRVLLGDSTVCIEEIDWAALLPTQEDTEWLRVNLKEGWFEIVPPAVDPRRSPSHLLLFVHERDDGTPQQEPVHVEQLEGSLVRLLYSPGWVDGVAAGDILRLLDDNGRFEVVERSGNVAVVVFSEYAIAPHLDAIAQDVTRLGGRIDGGLERSLVATIPISATLETIERVFDRWVAEQPDLVWWYNNIYDPEDPDRTLDWWL